jgi:hypothetical protein
MNGIDVLGSVNRRRRKTRKTQEKQEINKTGTKAKVHPFHRIQSVVSRNKQ